jgi:hypothetical protein
VPPPPVQQEDRQLQFSHPEVANGKFYHVGRFEVPTRLPQNKEHILIAGQPSALPQQAHRQQQQHQYDTPQQQAYQQQAAHVTQKPEEDDDDDFDIQLDIPQPAAQFRPEADDVSTKPCKRVVQLVQ